MPITQVRTAAPANTSFPDNVVYDQLGGKQGEGLQVELHGKYYTQAYRGNVFVGATAVGGVVIPIYTTTNTQTFAVWNPLGSNKNVVPLNVTLGYVSTAGIAGHVIYTYINNVGSVPATGAPITTFTTTAVVNANLGSNVPSIVKLGVVSGNVVTAAAGGTFLKTSGISQLAQGTNTATVKQWTNREDFDGSIIIPPGTVFFVTGNAALACTYDISMLWEEVPV